MADEKDKGYDTLRPPPAADGDAYSAATVIREAPPELIEAVRAARAARGEEDDAPLTPPPPPPPPSTAMPHIPPPAPAGFPIPDALSEDVPPKKSNKAPIIVLLLVLVLAGIGFAAMQSGIIK